MPRSKRYATPPATETALRQFLQAEQQQFQATPEALPNILQAIATAGKAISALVRRLDLADVLGAVDNHNPSGERQQKLDVIAHDCFAHELATVGEVGALISEEQADIVPLAGGQGRYIVALDPLDGSPNISANAPIGTIFSIYPRCSSAGAVQAADILQPGERQLAAGYLLYGTSTMLVYTARQGVHAFTYDTASDTFLLVHQALQMPPTGRQYAINDGYFHVFPSYVQRYIQYCRHRGYAARYMGALVADFHRHLMQGGIYLYPPTLKNPGGKLRLMLECNALALIAAQAGGAASNGQQSILTMTPTAIHQRVPFYIGTRHMVQDLLAAQ